jgi:DNA-binding NarL/FixJ family response regulator
MELGFHSCECGSTYTFLPGILQFQPDLQAIRVLLVFLSEQALRRIRFTASPKVAIVDDSSTIRHLVRLFIESHTDWQVCGEAGDGDAGVSLVQQLKPDLLVLDLLMPVMNGFDAARKIVAISPMTKIVLFTGHADEEVLKEAYSVGIRAVLSKNADHALQHLLAALHEADDTVHAA